MASPGDVQSIAQSQSQPGNVPSANPFEDELLSLLGDGPAPAVNEPVQDGQQTTSEVNAFQDTLRESNDPQLQREEPPAEFPADFDPNLELTDPIARTKAGFTTGSPVEMVSFATQRFGEDNVRVTERGVEFRPDETSKWRLIDDPNKTNIFDVLDASREITEGLVENVGRVGGFIAGAGTGAVEGAVVGAPLGPLGAATGAVATGLTQGVLASMATGAIGAPAAVAFVDGIQEKLLGIPIDPARKEGVGIPGTDVTIPTEKAMAAALGAGFNGLASWSGGKLARAKIKSRQFGDTLASMKDRINTITDSVEILERSGVKKQGDKVALTPGQSVGDIVKDIDAIETQFAKSQGYNNFIKVQGEAIEDAYMSAAELAGNIKGVRDPNFAAKISKSVFNSANVEGKVISEFRDQAVKSSKGQRYNLEKMTGALGAEMEVFGKSVGDTMDDVTPSDVLTAFPSLTKDQSEAYLGNITRLNNLVTGARGRTRSIVDKSGKAIPVQSTPGLTLKEVDREYRILRGKLDSAFNSNSGMPFAERFLRIKNAMRDDWTDIIGNELGPESKEAYQAAMTKFSGRKEALSVLNKTVLRSDISQEAFIKQMIGKGSNALPQLRITRSVIQQDNPQLWRDMVGEYFDGLKAKHTKEVTKAGAGREVNWAAMSKEWNGLGKEMQNEIFGGTDFKPEVTDALFTIGKHFQTLTPAAKASEKARSLPGKIVRAAVIFFSNTLSTQKADTGADLINAMGGSEQALTTWLNAGGIEQMSKFINKTQRPGFLQRMHLLTDTAINKIPGGALSVPAAKTTLRTKARFDREEQLEQFK